MLTVDVRKIVGVEVAPDSQSATLIVAGEDRVPVALKVATSELASLISVAIEARARLAGEPQSMRVEPFATWEVGTNAMADSAVLVFDRGTPRQAAFKSHPKTARQIGRALISQARRCDDAAAKRARN